MVLDYDRRPNATEDEKIQSLMENTQLALNEKAEKNLFQTLQEKVKGLINALSIRYVTETGSDNNWSYVKYSDGTFEAWRKYSGKASMTSSDAGTYYGDPIQITLPSFKKVITNCQGTAGVSLNSGIILYRFEYDGKLYFRSFISYASATVGAYLYIRGTY